MSDAIIITGAASRTGFAKRSSKWRGLRKKFIQGKTCAVCEGKTKLEVHHIIPFSLDPTKELDETNLIVLCEGRAHLTCHLIVGHGGNYRDYNPDCVKDAEHMNWLLTKRQKIEV